jgi:hypothetical protein
MDKDRKVHKSQRRMRQNACNQAAANKKAAPFPVYLPAVG